MRLEPFDIGYDRDPAATWRRLLADGKGVGFDPDLRLWLIAGYSNVRDALADGRRFGNEATLTPVTPLNSAAGALLTDAADRRTGVLAADPAQHTRLRSVLRAVLPTTADAVSDRWAWQVRRRVAEVVEDLTEHANVDLVEQFSRPLAVLVMIDALGLPAKDAAQIARWSSGVAELIWGQPGGEQQIAALRGYLELGRYCRQLVTDRLATTRVTPGILEDLLTYRAGEETRLTQDHIAALLFDLVLIGSTATAAALGHAIEYAVAEPQRWARVAADHHYRTTLIEESLRHSPAVDGCLRMTTTDTTLDDVTIPAGSRCLVLLGSTGHDPAAYENPHQFDPGRSGLSAHLAFGHGAHSCLGAALARLVLSTALHHLAQRLPELALATEHLRRFRSSTAIRAHTAIRAVTTSTTGGRCPVTHTTAEAHR
ncbi:cytochrome P450 [Actinoplanes sp. CA-054009]